MNSNVMVDYLAYVVSLLKDAAREAQQRHRADRSNELELGRLLGYMEALSTLQNQADIFDIPRELVGLDGPNADVEFSG